jgi:hypothetical protein
MTTSKLIAVTALAALGLAACSNNRNAMAGSGGGNRLCTPFTTAKAGTSTPAGMAAPMVQPSDAVDDCLHRWGYSLAASSDPAGDVAEATVAACTAPLIAWNQQAMTPVGPTGAAPTDAPSLLTGESTTPIAEHLNFAQRRALFYVVQARAGKCAPPPMTNGAPEASR